MYVRKHFKEEAKEAMTEMVRDIRKEFDHILDDLEWMDDSTRIRAKVAHSSSGSGSCLSNKFGSLQLGSMPWINQLFFSLLWYTSIKS